MNTSNNIINCKSFKEDEKLSKTIDKIDKESFNEYMKKAPYTLYYYIETNFHYMNPNFSKNCLEQVIDKYYKDLKYMSAELLNDIIGALPEKVDDTFISIYLKKVKDVEFSELEDYILDLISFIDEKKYKDKFNKQICDLVYKIIDRTNGHYFIHAYANEHQFLIKNFLELDYDINIVFHWIKNLEDIEYSGFDINHSLFKPIIEKNSSLEPIFALYMIK